jgi:hypothetical protein
MCIITAVVLLFFFAGTGRYLKISKGIVPGPNQLPRLSSFLSGFAVWGCNLAGPFPLLRLGGDWIRWWFVGRFCQEMLGKRSLIPGSWLIV